MPIRLMLLRGLLICGTSIVPWLGFPFVDVLIRITVHVIVVSAIVAFDVHNRRCFWGFKKTSDFYIV